MKNKRMIRLTVLMLVAMCACAVVKGQQLYATEHGLQYIDTRDTSQYRRSFCELDIYMPLRETGFKTLVWLHGGGLEGGKREVLDAFRASGFAVVTPDYRLFPNCKCPDYIRDAAAAVGWTVRNIASRGGDPKQVYVAGHSAGGYLTLMLALDKSYLAAVGIDADSIRGYFAVSGQTATHYTIRKERGLSFTTPLVDRYAPLNNVRRLGTRLMLITGDRRLEQMARYEENLYLKAVLDGIGNSPVPLYEMNGFDHGTVIVPAAALIKQELGGEKEK